MRSIRVMRLSRCLVGARSYVEALGGRTEGPRRIIRLMRSRRQFGEGNELITVSSGSWYGTAQERLY
jgi:hypothetical protein